MPQRIRRGVRHACLSRSRSTSERPPTPRPVGSVTPAFDIETRDDVCDRLLPSGSVVAWPLKHFEPTTDPVPIRVGDGQVHQPLQEHLQVDDALS